MTIEAFTVAAVLSALAYWLGYRTGRAGAIRLLALANYLCGIRALDTASRTVTFRDGSTHVERSP